MNYSDLLDYMPEEDRKFVAEVLTDESSLWNPLPGPQTTAYESDADIIGYGGAAGGGKTDLACGKALTRHKVSMILRREATQLTGIIDRITGILQGRKGYNGQEKIWRLGDRQIEFGSVPHLGDEVKYQGRPHDLIVFDEAANFLEQQVRFLLGWLRSTDPNQKCQALLTFNPPTTSDGRWILDFFGPWLNKKHPNPALPGELRYFATVNGEDLEVDSAQPFILVEGKPCYEFDPDRVNEPDIIKPLSRTFIPSRVADNPYLLGTGYMHTLQALPEPLRSQMLHGDFHAGLGEDPWQVIPTAWVEAAMERWKQFDPVLQRRNIPMTSVGCDVARGGDDDTEIARRHDWWFDEPLGYPGEQTPDGPKVAGLVIAATRDSSPQHVEINGVGASPVDFLAEAGQPVVGVDVSAGTTLTDRSGLLKFANQRTGLWWAMREALDPAYNSALALPPDKRLLAELTAPRWELKGKQLKVESREDIIKRIGNSPDRATAYVLANMDTPKRKDVANMGGKGEQARRDPYMAPQRGGEHTGGKSAYNPYDMANLT